jgi:hypothetical protein
METQKEDAAATAATDEGAEGNSGPVGIAGVEGSGDPSVEEIEQLREEALEDDDDSPSDLDIPAGDAGTETAEIVDVRESAIEQALEANVIHPTQGRQVWFWKNGSRFGIEQPEAATIAYVHSPRMVNLQVIDHNGEARGETSIPLVQPDDSYDEAIANGQFCEWMPFQKGQARAQSGLGIPAERLVNIGDDVYYGVGDCHFHIAKVTHINEDQTVDLVVFERERDHRVFNIAKADLGQPGCINGWAFKA